MTENPVELGRQIVVLIGPEGSGKSTMAEKLSVDVGKPHVATGKIIRELADTDECELGEACRVMFETHSYLPPDLLIKILTRRFEKPDTENGLILDGGLRTLEETKEFPDLLEKTHRVMLVSVVYLDIPKEVTMERLLTGKMARRRDDDTEAAIETRLSHFYLQLEERLDVISSRPNRRLIKIDATGTAEEVYQKICHELLKESTQ